MLRQCLLAQLLSARCCCVTAAKLALLVLPGPALPGPQLPAVELQTQPEPALLGPERAASAIFRGLQPKNAPSQTNIFYAGTVSPGRGRRFEPVCGF